MATKMNFDAIARFSITRKYLPSWVKQQILRRLHRVTIRTQDSIFLIDPKDNYTEFHLWKNGRLPEAKAIDEIQTMLGAGPLTVLDIGANVGGFSIPILKRANPASVLLAFEPQSALLERLQENLRLNNITGATTSAVAVGDAAGKTTFASDNPQNLDEMRMQTQTSNNAMHSFIVETLPDIVQSHKVTQIDLLKVDVEGFEDRVIVPLLEMQPKTLPRLIYFEIAHQEHWKYPLFEILAKHGYHLAKDFGENQLFAFAQ